MEQFLLRSFWKELETTCPSKLYYKDLLKIDSCFMWEIFKNWALQWYGITKVSWIFFSDQYQNLLSHSNKEYRLHHAITSLEKMVSLETCQILIRTQDLNVI